MAASAMLQHMPPSQAVDQTLLLVSALLLIPPVCHLHTVLSVPGYLMSISLAIQLCHVQLSDSNSAATTEVRHMAV